MRTNIIVKSDATTVSTNSFKTLLEQMKKLTDGGNIKVASKHWNIHKHVANNVDYGSPLGAQKYQEVMAGAGDEPTPTLN
jgi:hypothetical protein